MRVVQVNKYHFAKGGADRYYLDLSAALARRGCTVTHLSMRHARNAPAGPDDRFVEEVDYRGRMGPGAKLRHALRVVYNREAAAAARRIAERERPAVAHVHSIYHQLSPSVIGAFARRGVPIVQTLHDYKLICPAYLFLTGSGCICERCRGGKFHQAVRHRCLLAARWPSLVGAAEAYIHRWLRTHDAVRYFLCPSRFMLEKMASFGIERARLLHLPYFIPLERYRPAEGAPERAAVYVGRLSREKGIPTLIRAMALLPAGRLKLWVLGEGPLGDELRALVRETCPDRVELLGYRAGEALFDTIRRAAFAVVPSEWYENLPYAVLETFALGRPVVGARIGGIPELVEEGANGSLHVSGDARSLADALLRMTRPGADLVAMGAAARRKIEREFGEAAHLERLFEIYRDAGATLSG